MKKIGILTFYKAENYGAVLQAYALQKTIQNLGYDVNHVNFSDKLYLNNSNNSFFKKIKYIFNLSHGHFYKYIKTRNISHDSSKKFVEFRDANIVESMDKYNNVDISSADAIYDAFITGSDMVWSDIGQDIETYFLRFTSYDKRIAYAPSITGTDNYSIDKNNQMKKYIEGIKYLSVRENTGVDYIKKITNRDAFHAVDPTLLLSKNDWIKNLQLNKTHKKKYLLVYMFNGSKRINDKITKLANDNNLEVRYIPMTIEERYAEYKNGYPASYGPTEFLELFLNSSFVITNSFHGLLFSINFNIPFVLIHRGNGNQWKDHENRMNSVLKILGIENRYLNYDDEFDNALLNLNFEEINNKLNVIKMKSFNYLKKSLEDCLSIKKQTKKNISEIIKVKCTGCSACLNICPVNAIKMDKDNEGFFYPVINKKKCINCGKCLRVCQIEKKPNANKLLNSYVGCTKKSEPNSASGGIFYSIAKQFIEDYSGLVIGASLNCNNMEVEHIIIESKKELYKLQNSKYVQSNLNDIYLTVKTKLDNGFNVLFSGTPCQIVGLKNFLQNDYKNLYLIDIVCHGVPNNDFFKTSISHITNNNIQSLSFRHKDSEKKVRSTFQYKIQVNGKTKYIDNGYDPFYYSFINKFSYRISCYHCDYKNQNRYSDITLGDCDSWKFQKGAVSERANSILLINSQKGEKLLNLILDKIYIEPLDMDMEIKMNKPLSISESMPCERLSIYDDLSIMDWKKFKKKYTQKTTLFIRLKLIIKKIIKK